MIRQRPKTVILSLSLSPSLSLSLSLSLPPAPPLSFTHSFCVSSGGFEELCRDLHLAVPDTCLWAAGVTRLSSPPPCIRVVDKLTTALRCPPVVQREVERSTYIDGSSIPHYSKAAWPSPTDGPAIRWLEHGDQDGHDGSFPHECEQCGLHVGRLLHDLVVGQSGGCHVVGV